MFGYDDLMNEVRMFNAHGVETGVVGRSELGQTIPYVFVGEKNDRRMIVTGGIHAREHLTSLVVVCLAKYLVAHPEKVMLGGIYFVPTVNPDGMRLCQEGVGFVEDKERKSNLLAINGRNTDFSLWKANADGVDLNVNFDAEWGTGKSNVFCKSSENYVGKSPFSAAESRALAEFTRLVDPIVTLSYHLKGEEIYWYFGQSGDNLVRDEKLAQAVARHTGYRLVGDTRGSAGGYKDWCVQCLGIPSFTIEVGNDKFPHPFPYGELRNILTQNEDLPRLLLNTVARGDSTRHYGISTE